MAERDCVSFYVFVINGKKKTHQGATFTWLLKTPESQYQRAASTIEKWDHTNQIWKNYGKQNVSLLRTKPAAALSLTHLHTYTLTTQSLTHTHQLTHSDSHSHTYTNSLTHTLTVSHTLLLIFTHSLTHSHIRATRESSLSSSLDAMNGGAARWRWSRKISYLYKDYPAFPALLRRSAAGGNVPR